MHASLMNLYVRLSHRVSDFPVSESQISVHNVMNFKTVLTFPLTRIKGSTHKTRSFLTENFKLFWHRVKLRDLTPKLCPCLSFIKRKPSSH